MTSLNSSIFFNINYFVTFLLSLCFNTTLLYLIKRSTNSKLKKYSSILLQGVVFDILTSSVYVFNQSYYECTSGYLFYASIAPWNSFFDRYWKCSWVFPTVIVSVASNFSNPIQAFYRYMHFCLFTTLKPVHVFGIYCIGTVCVTGVAFIHFSTYKDINVVPEAIEVITTISYWRHHREELNNFCVGHLLNWLLIISMLGLIVIINSCAVLLFFFNNRVNSYLKKSEVHMIPKTIQLQQQISRQLMFQFCLPGLIGSIGIVCTVCMIILPEYSGGIVMLFFCPFHWIPVFNPLITIMCIKDYRRRIFRICKPASVQNGSTIVVPTVADVVDSKVHHNVGSHSRM